MPEAEIKKRNVDVPLHQIPIPQSHGTIAKSAVEAPAFIESPLLHSQEAD